MDVARTAEERKPSRALHRCHNFLCKQVSDEMGAKLVKDMKLLTVVMEGKTVCSSNASGITWTTFSRDHFSAEDLDLAKRYAEMP